MPIVETEHIGKVSLVGAETLGMKRLVAKTKHRSLRSVVPKTQRPIVAIDHHAFFVDIE